MTLTPILARLDDPLVLWAAAESTSGARWIRIARDEVGVVTRAIEAGVIVGHVQPHRADQPRRGLRAACRFRSSREVPVTPAYLLTLPDLHEIAQRRAWTDDEVHRWEYAMRDRERREAQRGEYETVVLFPMLEGE